MFLITRAMLVQGMSHYIYVAYRQTFAILAIAPFFFFFFERKSFCALLKLKHVCQIFLLAFLGIAVGENMYYAGLLYTSTTFAATNLNLIPAITFVMAYMLRMERVDLRSRRGQAKVVGTVACVAGAMTMTLLKGPQLNWLRSNENHAQPELVLGVFRLSTQWILGAAMLFTTVAAGCAYVLYQARIADEYPSQLSLSTLVLFLGCIQTLIIAFTLERPSAWKLSWDLQLFTCVYSGVVCSALGLFIQMWCVKERGPVFVTAFNPLSTVLVTIFEPLLFHVPLYLGSLVGMVLVIGGLYGITWGKALDQKVISFGTKIGEDETGGAQIAEPLLDNSEDHTLTIQ
ncbi:WAT1-related protein [Acorus calamus]|uniref:WAT1-related protein n=1 Tax=Acorus calamus TaxID=4465 RepID=A0AAV9D4C7_ACOCL|nr:WAT1-related protein [Acorus calamus]